jgi:hypothetical protein
MVFMPLRARTLAQAIASVRPLSMTALDIAVNREGGRDGAYVSRGEGPRTETRLLPRHSAQQRRHAQALNVYGFTQVSSPLPNALVVGG